MAMVEQIAGAAVTAVVLLDVFLTVLYARAGTELLSPVVSRTIWLVFRLVARPLNRQRGTVLSFCGPVILVASPTGCLTDFQDVVGNRRRLRCIRD